MIKFEKLGEMIKVMQEEKFQVVRSRGSLALQQTQRNTMKAELMDAFFEGLQEVGAEHGFDVFRTNDGIIIEVINDHVTRKVNVMKDEHEEGVNGYISIEHNLKIKNLDYDAEFEETCYLEELAEAERKAQEKEEAKRRKIERDAELRAGKARLREQRIAQLMKDEHPEN